MSRKPTSRKPTSQKPADKGRSRGRPKGSGIDDTAVLARVAARLAKSPGLQPTAAIRDLGIDDDSDIRRLRDKLKHVVIVPARPARSAAAVRTDARLRKPVRSEAPVALPLRAPPRPRPKPVLVAAEPAPEPLPMPAKAPEPSPAATAVPPSPARPIPTAPDPTMVAVQFAMTSVSALAHLQLQLFDMAMSNPAMSGSRAAWTMTRSALLSQQAALLGKRPK